MNEHPTTLLEAIRYFSDPDLALAFVVRLRWPTGEPACPRCGCLEHSFLTTRKIWKCKGCKRQFSAKVGTIFEDSPIGFDKWLPCVWLIANSKNSISSYEVSRALGVTQKTAWFMLHRVRIAMEVGGLEKLSGTVESDETFVGGQAKFMHARRRRERIPEGTHDDMTPVQGVVQRGGRMKAEVVSDTTKVRLQGNVRRWVEPGSAVYTDESRSYWGLDRYYAHKSVNHKQEYVSGDVHTNTMENFWSLLKRAIKGTQVHVSPEHLQRYVNERLFAYNNRSDSDLARMNKAVGNVGRGHLSYAALTGKD